MANLSNYLEGEIIEYFLRNDANVFTPVATLYLALFETDPTDAASGTEVTGGSYARQAITFTANASGVTENTAIIDFTDMPATTVTHYGVYDASTAGNLYFHGQFDSSIVTSATDTVRVGAGNLTLTMD